MKRFYKTFLCFHFLFLFSCSMQASTDQSLFAELRTDRGVIELELFYDKVPLPVCNFASLANGTRQAHGKLEPFYDGITFHRVIKDFMAQAGDPTATGAGGAGFKFADEFHPDLKHDSAGIVSMANSGPGTNGSQFFITHKATPWLDHRHAVFGKVTQGLDVVHQIKQGDKIKKITIHNPHNLALGDSACLQHEQNLLSREQLRLNQLVNNLYDKAELVDGIYIQSDKLLEKPRLNGSSVNVLYELTLLGSDEVIDSNFKNGNPLNFQIGSNQVIKGFEIAARYLSDTEELTAIIPYWQGYGEKGAGQAIPPKAHLVFKLRFAY